MWQVFRARRMCRSYSEKSVPHAHLLRILEAARRAPSAGHAQGVRFAVITEAKIRAEIAQAFAEPEFLLKGFKPWLSVAPVHIVAALSWQAYEERYAEPDKRVGPQQWDVPYPYLDAGQALMSLYLAAGELGLDCGFLGIHAGTEVGSLLQLPKSWEPLGLVTLGYASQSATTPTRSQRRGRRPFDEVVRWIP